jgi:hypothetical protein
MASGFWKYVPVALVALITFSSTVSCYSSVTAISLSMADGKSSCERAQRECSSVNDDSSNSSNMKSAAWYLASSVSMTVCVIVLCFLYWKLSRGAAGAGGAGYYTPPSSLGGGWMSGAAGLPYSDRSLSAARSPALPAGPKAWDMDAAPGPPGPAFDKYGIGGPPSPQYRGGGGNYDAAFEPDLTGGWDDGLSVARQRY